MLPNLRGFCEVFFFLGFQAFNPSLPTSILSKLLQPSNLLSFFLPFTNAYSLFSSPRRFWKQKISRFELKIMSRKKRAPNDPNRLLKKKRRELKVDPKFGGQWNVPSLVANGRRGISFQCLKANGKKKKTFQCLEANGMKRRSFFCSSFHFPPSNLLKHSFFSFDLMVLLYHNSKLLFMHSLLFSLAYKLQSHFSMS